MNLSSSQNHVFLANTDRYGIIVEKLYILRLFLDIRIEDYTRNLRLFAALNFIVHVISLHLLI